MCEEKMLSLEEAKGVYRVITEYLMEGGSGLCPLQRKAIGRLLSEIEFTNESAKVKAPPDLYPVS